MAVVDVTAPVLSIETLPPLDYETTPVVRLVMVPAALPLCWSP
jgi:hypothetical protein